ncbi:MAG: CRISPR-associated helicase Cas3' [Bryobacteraceae bacterium]
MAPSGNPIAHVRQDGQGVWHEHSLEDHLRGVSALAATFGSAFRSAEWAGIAGLWHDVGKYRKKFQHYIRSASGYMADAHIETVPGRVDHSTAGAIHAIERFGLDPRGRILGYLIAGHHAGLADWHADETGGASLSIRLGPQNAHLLAEALDQSIPSAILDATLPNSRPIGGKEGFALWVRMLFSCVVDADFLDTEKFMDAGNTERRGGFNSLETLQSAFDAHMQEKVANAEPTPVNRVRAEVLAQCRRKSREAPGVLSLTVPTGGGKTLSSLAFALDHALAHGKRRVIYAIPYTSIIEQTATILRGIFGDNIVEHHSNADVDESREDHRTRLACENWDAPIIVTTNVQFFESLFAARTSRARKLHNVVDSVVILDEAQLLPPQFLQPVLDVMRLLVEHYGVTFVLSTATQPALASRRSLGSTFRGLDAVREIVDDPDRLDRELKRVDVELPEDPHRPRSWEELASELCTHESVLCIVNTRGDCRELHALMPAGTVHLSALMCGQHRAEVIADVKRRLRSGEPVRVISTQLVEAGVDLDFPAVYRALAGLDSIAQAAGRCNREGRLARGRVVVFVPPKPSPPGILKKAEQTTISLLTGRRVDVLSRDLCGPYFEALYGKLDTDKHCIVDLLTPDPNQLDVAFRTASDKFRLIEDGEHEPVFVRYGEGEKWLAVLQSAGPQRWLMRKLQRYMVNLARRQFEKLRQQGDVSEVYPGMYVPTLPNQYDSVLGFLDPTADLPPDSLVI